MQSILPATISTRAHKLDDREGEIIEFDNAAIVLALVNAVKELQTRIEALSGLV
jgi:ribosomal protein L14